MLCASIELGSYKTDFGKRLVWGCDWGGLRARGIVGVGVAAATIMACICVRHARHAAPRRRER